MAKSPTNLPESSGRGYIKIVEGIPSNAELDGLLEHCIALSTAAKNESDDFTSRSFVSNAISSMPIPTARHTLLEFQKETSPQAIPLSVIRAMYSILPATDIGTLEHALRGSSLVYSQPPPEEKETAESRRFKKRMDQLRLQAEEKRYHKLTSNLDHVVEDDITTKSMTYAASIGLNMIVAPISFGVFMYFFAGQIFSWVDGGDKEDGAYAKNDKVNIKGVIAGVISGVFMLIVEMLLFVIRSHSFDKEITRKKKKKTLSPFGYTKPKAVAGVETNPPDHPEVNALPAVTKRDQKAKKES